MKSLLVCINTVFGLIGIVVCVCGGMLVSNQELIETYGDGIKDIGVGFIVLGVFTILTAMCGMCGVKSFNKKYMFGYCVVLAIILACELGFASHAVASSNAQDVYNLCVMKNTTDAPIDPATGQAIDCASFQGNDLRLGSYLLWQALWNDAQLYSDNGKDAGKYSYKKTQYVFLQHIQESGRCCGFGKPVEVDQNSVGLCSPSSKQWSVSGNSISYQSCFGYNSNADGSAVSIPGTGDTFNSAIASAKGLFCQYTPNPKSTFADPDCTLAGQASIPRLTEKTMQYDFPMGECVARCHAYGCAEAIYSYVQKRLAVIGLVVVLVVVVNAIALILAVCILCAHQTGLSDDDPNRPGIQNAGDMQKGGGKSQEMV
jgi:hypothetical protein